MLIRFYHITTEQDIPYLKVMEELIHEYLLTEIEFRHILRLVEKSDSVYINGLVDELYLLKKEITKCMDTEELKTLSIRKMSKELQLMEKIRNFHFVTSRMLEI